MVPSLADAQAVADGAMFTGAGLLRLYDCPGNISGIGVRHYASVPAWRRVPAARRIDQLGGISVLRTRIPLGVDRLQQVDRLPIALAGFLAILRAIAVGHLLVTSVRRRRRDFAI